MNGLKGSNSKTGDCSRPRELMVPRNVVPGAKIGNGLAPVLTGTPRADRSDACLGPMGGRCLTD